MTQLVEGELTEGEKKLLDASLLAEQDDTEWENIMEELIVSEPEQENYDSKEWNVVVQNILNPSQQVVESKEQTIVVAANPGRKRWMWIASVAAVLIIAISLWVVIPRTDTSLVQTKYAEQKIIALPDETEIVLNSNSTLNYQKGWQSGKPREVWLEGEALFRVRHINSNNTLASAPTPFIVHTSLVNIEVLGTVFNVRERRGKQRSFWNKARSSYRSPKLKNRILSCNLAR